MGDSRKGMYLSVLQGMIYLHDSELGSHGNLKSSNCLVDSRWVLTISDFGLHNFKMAEVPTLMEEEKYYKSKNITQVFEFKDLVLKNKIVLT